MYPALEWIPGENKAAFVGSMNGGCFYPEADKIG